MSAWVGWAIEQEWGDATPVNVTYGLVRAVAQRLVRMGVVSGITAAMRSISTHSSALAELIRGSTRLRVRGVQQAHHGVHTWWTSVGTRIRRARLPSRIPAAGMAARVANAGTGVVVHAWRNPGKWILSAVILAGVGLYATRTMYDVFRRHAQRELERRRRGRTGGAWRARDMPLRRRDPDDESWRIVNRANAWPDLLHETREVYYNSELLAYLAKYAMFRERNYELLLNLKNRGIRWLDDRKIREDDQERVLSGSVVMAFSMRQGEYDSLNRMASHNHEMGASLAIAVVSGARIGPRWRAQLAGWTRGLTTWKNALCAVVAATIGPTVRLIDA